MVYAETRSRGKLNAYTAAASLMVSAWIALLFATFKPGLISPDFISLYTQGMNRSYTSEHPPFLALLYGVSARIASTPWPVLLLQLAILGGGLGLLACSLDPKARKTGVLVLLVALAAPPTWSIGIALWKDVMMAAAFLLTVVCLRYQKPILSLVFLIIGVLFRHNAILAALPLIIASVTLLLPDKRRYVQRTAAVMGALVALILASRAVDYFLKPKDICMVCQPLAHDLIGIYLEDPKAFDGSVFSGEVSLDDLKKIYDPYNVIYLFYNSDPSIRQLDFRSFPARRAKIVAEWTRVVPEHLGIYIKHRLRLLGRLLGVTREPVYYAFHVAIDANPWGFDVAGKTFAYRFLRKVQERFRHSLFFRGWPWLLSCLILAVEALRRQPRQMLVFWIGVSGVVYSLGYLMFLPSADFRYLYWSVIAVFCGAILIQEDDRLMKADSPPRAEEQEI